MSYDESGQPAGYVTVTAASTTTAADFGGDAAFDARCGLRAAGRSRVGIASGSRRVRTLAIDARAASRFHDAHNAARRRSEELLVIASQCVCHGGRGARVPPTSDANSQREAKRVILMQKASLLEL